MFTACQKATPNLSSLTSLTGVALDQNYKTISSSTQPFSLSGKCNKNFSSIELSSNAGKTWTAITNLDPSSQIKCVISGNFSTNFSVSAVSATLASQLENGRPVSLMFRGNGSFGTSDSQVLSVVKSDPTPSQSITYGENLSINTSYRLTSRLSGTLSAAAASNGTYILNASLRSR